ncbi:MAG TPA: FHA domain-containing protein [Streptosporangiaceae bacterium]|nr:FHA domain-containing protein [Streptosporangiaceae bacterium]
MNTLQVSWDGQRYSFEQGQTVRIGRSTDNDVVVSDPTVSRQHAQLAWSPDGWVFEGLGRAGTFLRGGSVTRLVVAEPVELTLASPHGPVVRLEPSQPAGEAASPGPATSVGAVQGDGPPGSAGPRPRDEGTRAEASGGFPEGLTPGPSPPADWGAGAPPPGPSSTAAMPRIGVPLRLGAAAEARDELASAVQILVPVRSWLTDPGWRQGLRLLVIAYALLPLVFLALFASSGNLTTPGWAYSLYIAPLWGVAFWLLIRPPEPHGKQELLIGLGIVIWVMIWMSLITINVNSALNPKSPLGALLVGFNEEITKALPILVAALGLLKLRSVKLDVRMWMFLGTIAGLTFGVREASQYTTIAIEHIAAAAVHHSANAAVIGALSFAYRVFVDGFQHAIWAGVAAFFIGIGVNYPRRRVPLILFGVTIAALLHALNDWYLSNFSLPWPWILLQAFSLLLFLGYTMSAASIERRVRRTPLFRGESMIMDKFTGTGEQPRA